MEHREVRKFNLSKAQKYLEKLKTVVNDHVLNKRNNRRWGDNNESAKVYISVSDIYNLVSSEQELIDNYRNLVNESLDAYDTKLIFLQDFKALKNMVYTLNAKCELSYVLTQIDLLQEEKNMLNQIKTGMEGISYLPESKLGELYNRLTNENITVSNSDLSVFKLKIHNYEDIKQKLRLVNIKLEELETKRDQLNATTTMEFSFHKKTLDLLGI